MCSAEYKGCAICCTLLSTFGMILLTIIASLIQKEIDDPSQLHFMSKNVMTKSIEHKELMVSSITGAVVMYALTFIISVVSLCRAQAIGPTDTGAYKKYYPAD